MGFVWERERCSEPCDRHVEMEIWKPWKGAYSKTHQVQRDNHKFVSTMNNTNQHPNSKHISLNPNENARNNEHVTLEIQSRESYIKRVIWNKESIVETSLCTTYMWEQPYPSRYPRIWAWSARVYAMRIAIPCLTCSLTHFSTLSPLLYLGSPPLHISFKPPQRLLI